MGIWFRVKCAGGLSKHNPTQGRVTVALPTEMNTASIRIRNVLGVSVS